MPIDLSHHPYLKNNISRPLQITSPPPENLGYILVIPCFNEPSICTTLSSIASASPPHQEVEVIIVINASESDPAQIQDQNRRSIQEIHAWIEQEDEWKGLIHILHYPELPHKQAGVGLARKLGMDEALARFATLNHPDGLILSLDADCTIKSDYFLAIERHFIAHPARAHGHVYFEHPLSDLSSPHLEAMISYELYLRCFVHGLRYSGLWPYAFHTVGSTMICKAKSYAAVGGMNKRQAGEDFYFMQKLMQLSPFQVITSTCVYPSPRVSMRVPFGTGRAVLKIIDEEHAQRGYHPESFEELKRFLTPILTSKTPPSWDSLMELKEIDTLRIFMNAQRGADRYREILEHTRSTRSFRRRFFQWFNGFLSIKFLNFARNEAYPEVPVIELASWLLKDEDVDSSSYDLFQLLNIFRTLDQKPQQSSGHFGER